MDQACEKHIRADGLTDEVEARVDLDYGEDFDCDVDLNLVFTGSGRLVEVQGTAEAAPFSLGEMSAMLALAENGIREIITAQDAAFA